MRLPHLTWPRLSAWVLGLAALLVTLAGCGTGRRAGTESLAPAPLPVYGLGDSYQFNDGSTDTVVSANPDAVMWQARDGTYTTPRDILLPPLAWSNSVAQGQRRILAGTDRLFPLQPDSNVTFSATSTVRPSAGSGPVTATEDGHCQVIGVAAIETPAGRFDTWRVDCAMTALLGASQSTVEQRSFFYAPDIGYYVRREERIGDAPQRVIDLTAFTSAEPALPETVLRQRSAAIQRALETALSGERETWSDTASGDSGYVRVLNTMRSARYGFCREFDERVRAAGRLYQLQGTGCRDPSGLWRIVMTPPDLRAGG